MRQASRSVAWVVFWKAKRSRKWIPIGVHARSVEAKRDMKRQLERHPDYFHKIHKFELE